jgi:hypothetical protein
MKSSWKVGDWAVFDLDIVQIKQLDEYCEVSTGIINTSGDLVDRLRPLTLRNKVIVESMKYMYRELKSIRGESGFNYPDISEHFNELARNAIDSMDTGPYMDAANSFVQEAQKYTPIIQGINLFR